MKKRTYRTAYTEAIRELYELFIKPAIKKLAWAEDDSSLGIGLRRFFHVDERSVHFAKSKVAFTIKGSLWIADHSNQRQPGVALKRVQKGESMIVRIDTKMPDRIDVEFKDQQIFSLTEVQWKTVEEHVELIG